MESVFVCACVCLCLCSCLPLHSCCSTCSLTTLLPFPNRHICKPVEDRPSFWEVDFPSTQHDPHQAHLLNLPRGSKAGVVSTDDFVVVEHFALLEGRGEEANMPEHVGGGVAAGAAVDAALLAAPVSKSASEAPPLLPPPLQEMDKSQELFPEEEEDVEVVAPAVGAGEEKEEDEDETPDVCPVSSECESTTRPEAAQRREQEEERLGGGGVDASGEQSSFQDSLTPPMRKIPSSNSKWLSKAL